MSDFKSKMYLIQFQPPDPAGRAYSAAQTHSWIKGRTYF